MEEIDRIRYDMKMKANEIHIIWNEMVSEDNMKMRQYEGV